MSTSRENLALIPGKKIGQFSISSYFQTSMLLGILPVLFLASPASTQLDIPYRDDLLESVIGRAGMNNLDYRNVLARLEFQGVQQCSNNVATQWQYETNVNELSQLQAVSLIPYRTKCLKKVLDVHSSSKFRCDLLIARERTCCIMSERDAIAKWNELR